MQAARPPTSGPLPPLPGWLGDPTATRRYGALLGIGSLLGGEIDQVTPPPPGTATRRIEVERYLHRNADPTGVTRLVRQWQGDLNKRQLRSLSPLFDTFDQLAAALEPLPTMFSVDQRSEVIAAYHRARLNAG